MWENLKMTISRNKHSKRNQWGGRLDTWCGPRVVGTYGWDEASTLTGMFRLQSITGCITIAHMLVTMCVYPVDLSISIHFIHMVVHVFLISYFTILELCLYVYGNHYHGLLLHCSWGTYILPDTCQGICIAALNECCWTSPKKSISVMFLLISSARTLYVLYLLLAYPF